MFSWCGEHENLEEINELDYEDYGIGGEPDADEDLILHVGMTFVNLNEFIGHCHLYAKKNGFSVRIRNSTTNKEDRKEDNEGNAYESGKDKYKAMRLICSKGGEFVTRSRYPGRGPSSCSTGCQFHVNVSVHADELWKITKLTLDHNHECAAGNSKFLASYRYIRERNKKRIFDNDRAGVQITKNFSSLIVAKGGYDKLPFYQRDVRNLIAMCRRLHMDRGDFNAMRDYFDMMSTSKCNFVYRYDQDDDERLRNIFWADGRSIVAYQEFRDVISFYTTYVSNRYKMPFAPFIGVNYHGQSVLFGCALLGGVEIGNFLWLFRTWLDVMSGKVL